MTGRVAQRQATATTRLPGQDVSFGIVGALRQFCDAAVHAMPASGAGLILMTANGVHMIAAASDATGKRIDQFEFGLEEGPCMDAFASRKPVLEADLNGGGSVRWPLYAAAAHNEGVRATFAFPVLIGGACLGVFELYRTLPGPLSADELALALRFADLAGRMLLDSQEHAKPGCAAGGLVDALEDRFELHQAQGMVMAQLAVGPVTALASLRNYACSHDRSLGDVARDVVTRILRLDQDAHDES